MKGLENNDNAQYSQFYDEISDITAGKLDIDRRCLDLNKSISEYDLDSIAITEIIKKINKIYRLNLSPAIMFGHKTLDSLIKYLFEIYRGNILNSDFNKEESLKNLLNNEPVEERQSKLKEKQPVAAQSLSKDYANAIVKDLCFEKQTKKNTLEKPTENKKESICENEIPDILNIEKKDKQYLILLSAENKESLEKNIKNLLKYLKNNMENESILLTLERLLIFERDSKQERLAIIVASVKELYQTLKDYLSGKKSNMNIFAKNSKQEKKQINLFLFNEDSKKLLLRWVKKGEIDKIALFWLNGIRLDWGFLFEENYHNVFKDQNYLSQLNEVL